MEKLKKCPFCGGKAIFKTNGNLSLHYGVGLSFLIECDDCGINLNRVYKVEFSLTESGEINSLHDERSQAVQDWNRRCRD